MQTVVAALIWRNCKVLIAQRSSYGPHPLEWEFPGGKAEEGETAEGALRRELLEELGIQATIGAPFACYEYSYPSKSPILLQFFLVAEFEGRPENRGVFEQLVWEEPQQLSTYNFLAGDLPLIQLLREFQVDQV